MEKQQKKWVEQLKSSIPGDFPAATKQPVDAPGRGVKKSFFLQNADELIDLAENYGVLYQHICNAILEHEGIYFDLQYFRELMAEEKERRKLEQSATVSAQPVKQASQVKPVMKQPAQPGKAITSAQDMSPEKQEYIATLEEIKNRNDLSSKERRALMKEAEEKFSNTLSKLGR